MPDKSLLSLNKIIELAINAGEAIIKIYQRDFSIEYKEDKSPLTEADLAANEIIIKGLRGNFPESSILSEEYLEDQTRFTNDWCFIVDPLDGTKEFIKRNGEFTVNIALTYKQRPVLGVVYVPVTGELYYAVKGKGAFYQSGDKIEKIKVSSKIENLILMKSRSHASEKLNEIIKNSPISTTKAAGSSLKGCLVAKGEADIYYRFNPTMEWDTAAMHCIVEEAGGTIRQMDNSELLYNRKDSVNRKGFYIVNREENIFV